MKVIKKDGREEEWDSNKIKKAISKSADRVMVSLSEDEKQKVCGLIKEYIGTQEIVGVSDLHKLVEKALDEVNPEVAKSYREYRDFKTSFAKILDRVYNKKLSLSFIGDRSNANADSALVTTQKAIVYNELNSELYKKFFLNKEEEEAMSDGYIYIHDRGSRLDTMNCCLLNISNILNGGFEMGNLTYKEPNSLDVAFDLVADVSMSAAASEYGGLTIPEVDKVLAPYAEKSYQKYKQEYKEIIKDFALSEDQIEKNADEYAMKKVRRDYEQGFQGWEMKFNSVSSSRGDYPFTSISFGIGTNRFETMASSVCLQVRKGGQGANGFKHPVLFPKLTFLYDENLHGEGKELEWLFNEAIECSRKAMYPDFLSLTGEGYIPSMYKKYGKVVSLMGKRNLAHVKSFEPCQRVRI